MEPRRLWTVDEARAYLPRLREVLATITRAVAARGNGAAPHPEHVEAALAELEDEGIILRDPLVGLIDFPARGADGVVYLLCFRADEDDVTSWHLPEEGFAGRKPLPRSEG